jgi:hypothetical protein
MARAAMAAVEPLVEILLEMGVTSPEAESLLRSVFVHRARSWLVNQSRSSTEPSDARISLVTGVHRNFVRHILAERPKIAKSRQKRGNRADRVLSAWHTDSHYLDGSGKPRDLPERGGRPSFHSLATTYLPGAAPGIVLDELMRAGAVQSLPEGRLRVRSKSFRVHGLNPASVVDVGSRAKGMIETLTYNLHHRENRRVCESMPSIEIEEDRIAAVREIIARRASTFLARMEHELASAVHTSKAGNAKKIRMGLTIFATER